jgi:hypothetical protein
VPTKLESTTCRVSGYAGVEFCDEHAKRFSKTPILLNLS